MATKKKAPAKKVKKTGRPSVAQDKLDAMGIAEVCRRIECGESMREIVATLEMDVSTLSRWLSLPGHLQQSARAREESAESWLDRGLTALETALPDAAEIARARAIEQACARRAALRNPRYVEKTAHEHTGPGGGPMDHSLTVTFK